MDATFTKDADGETIRLARRPPPVGLLFIVVPALLVPATLAALLTYELPMLLIGLLLCAVVSSLMLAKTALNHVAPITVRLTTDALQFNYLLGGGSFDWDQLGDIKLVPSAGTLVDDPLSSGTGRLGIGVWLRTHDKTRETQEIPDEILYAGTEADAAELIKAIDQMQAFKRRVQSGVAGRGRSSLASQQPIGFRKAGRKAA